MSYPFSCIWINGRSIPLEAITNERVIARSPFEDHTFAFIRDWLSGQETFTIHTSGSTGTPKPISVTRAQMIASARLSAQALGLEQNFTALVCIDTRYIGGQMMLVRSFVTGMKIMALDPCACPLLKIPIDACVNFSALVPYQVQAMLESKHPHFLNNPNVIIIGGAPLDEHIVEQLAPLLCRCYATYGMTETISHVALRPLNGKEHDDRFRALPGITLQKDDRGCLTIDAPYLQNKIFTNDLVELTDASSFRWLGRWDNVINTGGVKVIPEKIEAALIHAFAAAGISVRFFIHGIPDQRLGTKVALVAEASGGERELLEKIFPEIISHLSPYEKPRELLITPQFSTTETGKINRINTLKNLLFPASVKK
jgi:o-succinylbenzoate---CoA ligase